MEVKCLCGTTFEVHPSWAGRTVNCLQCQMPILVAAQGQPAPTNIPSPSGATTSGYTPRPAEPPKPVKHSSALVMIAAFAVIVIGAVIAVVAVRSWMATVNPAPFAKREPFRVKTDDNGPAKEPEHVVQKRQKMRQEMALERATSSARKDAEYHFSRIKAKPRQPHRLKTSRGVKKGKWDFPMDPGPVQDFFDKAAKLANRVRCLVRPDGLATFKSSQGVIFDVRSNVGKRQRGRLPRLYSGARTGNQFVVAYSSDMNYVARKVSVSLLADLRRKQWIIVQEFSGDLVSSFPDADGIDFLGNGRVLLHRRGFSEQLVPTENNTKTH